MSDLIERQAAIDLMQMALEDDWELDYATDRINELPSAQQWIPCSERMPEKGQKCLVCDKGTIAIDTFIGNGKPYDWRWYMRDYEAWMPLPEPYQPEEYTMEEFMYGQDMGNPEDGSL